MSTALQTRDPIERMKILHSWLISNPVKLSPKSPTPPMAASRQLSAPSPAAGQELVDFQSWVASIQSSSRS